MTFDDLWALNWAVSVWKRRVFHDSRYLFSSKSDWHTNGKLKRLEAESGQTGLTFQLIVIMWWNISWWARHNRCVAAWYPFSSGVRGSVSPVLNISTPRRSQGETSVHVGETRVKPAAPSRSLQTGPPTRTADSVHFPPVRWCLCTSSPVIKASGLKIVEVIYL